MDENAAPPSDEEMQQMYADVSAFNAELMATDAFVFAGGLQPSSAASVVRVIDGDPQISSGPFHDSNEQMGGFWVIRASDLDAAQVLATQASLACSRTIEVRPFNVDEDD